MYKDILAIGHVGSASEHWTSGVTGERRLQVMAIAPSILRRESRFIFTLSKETHIMDTITKTAVVIAFVVVPDVVLFSHLFGKKHV
jgi:hypothetical protein